MTATIDGQPGNVVYAGLTPGFAGLAPVNVQVPDLPAGDYPLVITAGPDRARAAADPLPTAPYSRAVITPPPGRGHRGAV